MKKWFVASLIVNSVLFFVFIILEEQFSPIYIEQGNVTLPLTPFLLLLIFAVNWIMIWKAEKP